MVASKDVSVLDQLAPAARQLILGTCLEDDQVRLQQLLALAAADQAQVVRLHLNLTVPWDQAISSFAPMDPKPRILGKVGDIVMVDVDDLRPNCVNCTVFSDSLTDAGIDPLVEDMGRRKQRVPVEITLEAELIEGERRWRAARKRGDKQIAAKIIAERMTESEVRAYIFDAHATGRDASLLERIRFYQLAVTVLKERHGLRPGRPKPSSNEEGLTGDQIRERAARRAGLGSAEKARRAIKVLESADDEIRTAMLAQAITINGAYGRLAQSKDARSTLDDVDTQQEEGDDDDLQEQRSASPLQQLRSVELDHQGGPPPAAPGVIGLGSQAARPPEKSTNRSEAGTPRVDNQGAAAESGSVPKQQPTPPAAPRESSSHTNLKLKTPDGSEKTSDPETPRTHRAPSKKGRAKRPDYRIKRRAFEQVLESIVKCVLALHDLDQAKGRQARDEAVLRLNAAIEDSDSDAVDEDVESTAIEEQEAEDDKVLENEDADDEDEDDDDQADNEEEDLNEVEQEYLAESDPGEEDFEEEDFEEEEEGGASRDPQEAEIERLVPSKRARRL